MLRTHEEIIAVLGDALEEKGRQDLIAALNVRTLYVPAVGDKIKLVQPWTFWLHNEARNESLFVALGRAHDDVVRATEVTLPKDTVLKIERVYVRGGGYQHANSLTFRVVSCPDEKVDRKVSYGGNRSKPRFWARLVDTNRIEFTPLEG